MAGEQVVEAPVSVPESAPAAEPHIQAIESAPIAAEPAANAAIAEPQAQVIEPEPTVPEPEASAPVDIAPTAPPVPVAPVPSASPTLAAPPARAPGHFGRYSVREAQDMAKHAREAIFERKAEKIFAFIKKQGSIRHHQVMDLLHVSRPMAYLYLWRLKREGKLIAAKKGKDVYYTLPGTP